jgi:hypothetical protein
MIKGSVKSSKRQQRGGVRGGEFKASLYPIISRS